MPPGKTVDTQLIVRSVEFLLSESEFCLVV
eukprot:SAG31_NODE_35935_length_318_cov_0.707763_1_plen_29_part_10